MEKSMAWKNVGLTRFAVLTFVLFLLMLILNYGTIHFNPRNLNTLNAPVDHDLSDSSRNPTDTVDSHLKINVSTSQVSEDFNVSDMSVNVTEKRSALAPVASNMSIEMAGPPPLEPIAEPANNVSDSCTGRFIYMHDLPSRFNEDLLNNCHKLLKWEDMCPFMKNFGFGRRIYVNSSNGVSDNGWYATQQFALEVIFHNRMKHYKCLTNYSSLASAVYVPYYAGLDVGQYLWDSTISMRDANPLALVKWLAQRPEWKTMSGRDHFLVGGRIGVDFRRSTDDANSSDCWGTKFMFLPEAQNMSILPIETSFYDNEFSIPYPTYFHPSNENEVIEWQMRMRRVKRPYLFAFAGAPRDSPGSIRTELIEQCQSSNSCYFLSCFNNGGRNKCDDPITVMKVFQSSTFCLQPSGDSYTRRSTFDSILAGCIPVFFHPGSAYVQYLWHLPDYVGSYSVFIPEENLKKKITILNETLLHVPQKRVLEMREEVINLIPRIIYAHPNFRLSTIEDAFDIAVKKMLERIDNIRKAAI